MINTREFRIGNLLIEKNSGKIIEVINLTQKHISFSGQFKAGWQAEPIPLNEDWLLKFGFTKYDQLGDLSFFYLETRSGKNWNICLSESECLVLFYESQWDQAIKLENLHSLQNLFYIVEKEELKLNDK